MLITTKDPKTGEVTPQGLLLQTAGLSAMPDSFNVDDGFVERGRQQAMVDHPQLSNQDWVNMGLIYAARQFRSDHPAMGSCRLCSESPLEHDQGGVSEDHKFLPKQPSFVGISDPIANAMHEAVHGVEKPVYVDASEPLVAAAERKAAELKKVPTVAADDHGTMTKEQVEAISAGAQTVEEPKPDTPEVVEAIAFIVGRGYTEEKARDIISRHGVEQILSDKREVEAKGLPSNDDLDQVAEEEKAKDATSGKKGNGGPKPAKVVKPN